MPTASKVAAAGNPAAVRVAYDTPPPRSHTSLLTSCGSLKRSKITSGFDPNVLATEVQKPGERASAIPFSHGRVAGAQPVVWPRSVASRLRNTRTPRAVSVLTASMTAPRYDVERS